MTSYIFQEEAGEYFKLVDCIILDWPRQSGKTYYSTFLMNKFLIENSHKKGAFFTLGIFLSFFDKKLFESFGKKDQILHATNNSIEYRNKSELTWYSVRSTAHISHTFDFIVLDEYMNYDKRSLDNIYPILSVGSKMIFCGSPGDEKIKNQIINFLNRNKIKYFIHKI